MTHLTRALLILLLAEAGTVAGLCLALAKQRGIL